MQNKDLIQLEIQGKMTPNCILLCNSSSKSAINVQGQWSMKYCKECSMCSPVRTSFHSGLGNGG